MRKGLFHLTALLVTILIFSVPDVFSQPTELLQKLHSDTLYFKAPDHRLKIEGLIKLQEDENQPGKYQDKISALNVLDQENYQKLESALDSCYTFSAYRLIKSEEFLVWKALQKENRFVAYWGKVESGASAILIANIDLEPYQKPFPYYIRQNTFATFINSILYSRYARENEYYDLIQRLDKKLWKALEKMKN